MDESQVYLWGSTLASLRTLIPRYPAASPGFHTNCQGKGRKSFIDRREPAFQAVGGNTEVSENRLPLTPLFAFASRHCCPAAPAETGSICSAYAVCIFRIIRLFEAVEKLHETGLL